MELKEFWEIILLTFTQRQEKFFWQFLKHIVLKNKRLQTTPVFNAVSAL